MVCSETLPCPRMLRLGESFGWNSQLRSAAAGFEVLAVDPGNARQELLRACLEALSSARASARRVGAELLGDLIEPAEHPNAIEQLTRAMETDGDWRVRAHAFESLAELEPVPVELCSRIQQAMRDDPEPRFRLHACWVSQFVTDLAPFDSALEDCVRDGDSRVRRAAYRVLRTRRPSLAPPRLGLLDRCRMLFDGGKVTSPILAAQLEDLLGVSD